MKNIVPIVAIALAIALSGCQAADTAPSPGLGDPYPAPMNDPQITVLAPELQKWLAFHPAIIQQQTDGRKPMRVEHPVRNMANRQYLIEYRILFYDRNGLQVNPIMGWTPAPLEPKQAVRLTAGAPDANAVSHRIEVRWSR